MRLSQIALSVGDVRRTQRWYRDVVGLEPAGGTNLFAGPLASRVQGVPHSASTCWWLVDRQELFQVELFEFRSPLVRALPFDWRPSDIGYSTISVSVDDLDAAGRELARLAAEDGTSLALVDRPGTALPDLAGELANGADIATREVDFTDLEALDGAAAELVKGDPDIDLLIAAAGVDRAQSMLAFDWRRAREDFDVNALANLVLLSHLAPAMMRSDGGHVTSIASLAGLVGMPFEAAYSSSKAALATITESARAELEPRGITFPAVFPGSSIRPCFAPTPSSTPIPLRLGMPPSSSIWRPSGAVTGWTFPRSSTRRRGSRRRCPRAFATRSHGGP